MAVSATVLRVGAILADLDARPKLGLYLKTLCKHRHFTLALSIGRVKSSVSDTRLGLLWLLLVPLVNAAVFYLVFGVLLGERQTTESYALFLIVGVLAYSVLSRALQAGATAPKALSGMAGSLPVPKASGDSAAILTELIAGAWVVPLLLLVALFSGHLTPGAVVLASLACALLAVFCLGLGLSLACAARVLPDTTKATPFLLRAGAFLFGVYFPLSVAVEQVGTWGGVLEWSPVAVYLDLLRDSLVYGELNTSLWASGVAWAVVALLCGLALSWRQESRHG